MIISAKIVINQIAFYQTKTIKYMTQSNSFEQVKPKIQLLNEEQMQEVHKYSTNILENTGIKVESKTAREIFAKSGAVKIEDEVVYIQGELVDHSIKWVQ